MNDPVILTVTQLNAYVRSLLEGDARLASVFLGGEISNFTDHYRSGHLYFSLKDAKSAVKAVMFSSYARRLRFRPADGMKVIVRGRVSLYEAGGQYQFYAEDMQPDGLGALNLAYEQLKSRLAAEGLFDASRKRPLPRFPRRIGLATSPTGAAVHDVCRILARRFPLAEVVFCPVQVQGEGAARQIAEAVRRFQSIPGVDVLIVGRGGGSLEDLWAFNEEIVARAVAASRIPVISAVGHETDFTICDFAADVRAATPSAAAELAVPDAAEWEAALCGAQERLRQAAVQAVREAGARLESLRRSPAFARPMELASLRRMQADALSDRLRQAMEKRRDGCSALLRERAARLETLSPLRVLARGYASVSGPAGRPLTSVHGVHPGERLTVRLRDGALDCEVMEIRQEEDR